MDLYVVLSEQDGTGVLQCYLLVAIDSNNQVSKSADSCAITSILEQFLQPLKTANFESLFFHCDKDEAEIAAIKLIWPDAVIRLCFWHAKRAIRNKLKDNKKTRTQAHYFPYQAKALVPRLEICWGSHSTRRPGDHKYGRCEYFSSSILFEESGSIPQRDVVLEMFSRHFNMHSLIPDQNGTYRSAERIHIDCVNELYTWCHSRNYFHLQAYLFVNWYGPEQWKLWARSSCSESIPVLKTTMVVESHWRRIKYDYLYRYNRPRIDLVVSILTSLVIPQDIDKMNDIRCKNHRKAVAAWRKAFKKNWDNLQDSVVYQDLLKYHTDPIQWTCACPRFLLSRFLVCKHIKHCFEEISDRSTFFTEIHRQRESPFWVHEQLTLRSKYQPSQSETPSNGNDGPGLDDESSSENDFSGNGITDLEVEDLDADDGVSHLELKSNMAVKTTIIEILKQQESISNTKFLEVYFKGKIDIASDENSY